MRIEEDLQFIIFWRDIIMGGIIINYTITHKKVFHIFPRSRSKCRNGNKNYIKLSIFLSITSDKAHTQKRIVNNEQICVNCSTWKLPTIDVHTCNIAACLNNRTKSNGIKVAETSI